MNPVKHYRLDPRDSLHSTYASTLKVEVFDEPAGVDDHPGSFSARPARTEDTLKVHLFHGRDTEDEDLNDWGYTGPEFECQSIAHDPDRLLLQQCDALSTAMAVRLGLAVHADTVTIEYGRDGVLKVPRFRDEKPAFFGDFVIRCT